LRSVRIETREGADLPTNPTKSFGQLAPVRSRAVPSQPAHTSKVGAQGGHKILEHWQGSPSAVLGGERRVRMWKAPAAPRPAGRGPSRQDRLGDARHHPNRVEQYVGSYTHMPTKRIIRPASSTRPTRQASALGGIVRSRELEARGTPRVAIGRLVEQGLLVRLGRGLYAPAAFSPTEHHGLALAAALAPTAVVCLLSALQFHRLTTQAPFEVWLAVGGKARKPRLANLPARVVRFGARALNEGVEVHHIEGVPVHITSIARTVADCFKYRNKIGLDVALEALRGYRRTRRSLDELVRAARVVRVEQVIRPYLEAIAA
jgi:hypothetical protein